MSGDASTEDVLLGHDEDGDGVADVDDVCPHLFDDHADTDLDLVGDACDPEPANPRQFWIAFDPMFGDSSYFNTGASWTVRDDSLECAATATPAQLVRGVNYVNVDIIVGADTLSTAGASHTIGIVVRQMEIATYSYVELYGTSGTNYLQVMEYDGAGFNLVQRSTLAPSAPLGGGFLRAHANTSGIASLRMDGGFAGTYADVSSATPSYIGGNLLVIAFANVAANVRYVAIIGTNPP